MNSTHPSVAEMLDLTGRGAVVTGGAMGIGRAVAERLAEAGASVVVADLDGKAAEATAQELQERDLITYAVQMDVGDEESVLGGLQQATEHVPDIDLLVNNAGIFPSVPVLEMAADEFDRVLRVNLRGTYLLSRHVALGMRERGHGGRIINITSIDALHPSSVGLAHYDASKHGMWGFTKNLARELAPLGISVNAVAPGAVATPGAAQAQAGAGALPAGTLEAFLARIPLGRIGEPDDIARVVLFLASDLASYVTGSQVVVDGGVLLS